MSNWDIYYSHTLNNINKNIDYFKKQIIKYYYLITKNKEYKMKNNYIISKNIAIFTYFNNIPDIFHPLPKYIYFDYACYISYINPIFFNLDNKRIIIYNQILTYNKYKYPLSKQDITPYNNNKKNISINIKYYNKNKYDNNIILIYTKYKKLYFIYNKNVYIKKQKHKWIHLNNINYYDNIINNAVYINILRKFQSKELFLVFNKKELITKNTKIYSYHTGKDKNVDHIEYFSLKEDEYLNDPYNIWPNDDIYKYSFILKKNMKFLNLNKNVFSNNNLSENIDINIFLNLIYNNKNINKINKDNIYNGELNYILPKDNNNVFYDNKGKRLLHEIIFKNSNFIHEEYYHGYFLEYHKINKFIYSMGYYEKLNKFYNYELYCNRNIIKNIKLQNRVLQFQGLEFVQKNNDT